MVFKFNPGCQCCACVCEWCTDSEGPYSFNLTITNSVAADGTYECNCVGSPTCAWAYGNSGAGSCEVKTIGLTIQTAGPLIIQAQIIPGAGIFSQVIFSKTVTIPLACKSIVNENLPWQSSGGGLPQCFNALTICSITAN